MTSSRVYRWTPGAGVVVAWPGGVALIEDSISMSTAERIWTSLRRESQLGVFLKILSEDASGFLNLPDFAVAIRDGARCHVAVRGSMTVALHSGDDTETLSGENVTTWAERMVSDVSAVRLGRVEAGDASSPIADGVVTGGGVLVGDLDWDTPQVAEPAEPTALEEPAEVAGHTTLAEADDSSAAQPEKPEPTANPYDSLWDHSIALDVEAAAIREEAEPAEATPTPPSPEPLAEVPAEPEEPSSDGIADQLSGDTIADAGEVDVHMPEDSNGEQVLARFCDRGHANPPERAECFVCGTDVTGEARSTERPQLGWLRIEGGETIPLRGPIIAGRNPKSTVIEMSQTPRLVALPHPHISSTHLAIVIEGWRILVRDLNSSNGTYLRRHGEPPVRLPDAEVPVVPGDLIDLGKGVFLHLERTP